MREKPNHEKKRYAFFVSLSFTAIIFVFWMASFGFGGTAAKQASVEVQSPLESVTASAGNAFDYVRDMIFGGNKKAYNSDGLADVEVTAER